MNHLSTDLCYKSSFSVITVISIIFICIFHIEYLLLCPPIYLWMFIDTYMCDFVLIICHQTAKKVQISLVYASVSTQSKCTLSPNCYRLALCVKNANTRYETYLYGKQPVEWLNLSHRIEFL